MQTIVFAWRQDRVGCGQRLRLLREASSLSQRALAEQCDLTIGAISRLERGVTAPLAATIARLATVLHAAPEDFIRLRSECTEGRGGAPLVVS